MFTPEAKTKPKPRPGVSLHSSLFGSHQELLVSPSGSKHTIETAEKVTLASFINQCLKSDEQLLASRHVPLDCSPYSEDLFDKLKDGLILAKLIHFVRPGVVALQRFAMKPTNTFQTNENLNLVIQGAHNLGLKAVNIGAQDISNGR